MNPQSIRMLIANRVPVPVAVYIRTHPGHAWRLERFCERVSAMLGAKVNKQFGIEMLVTPVLGSQPVYFHADQPEADFPALEIIGASKGGHDFSVMGDLLADV
jgi:hypothetical protein